MSLLVLLIIVLLQILLFQFVAVFLARSLPAFLVGERDLPPDLSRDVERFRQRAGVSRFLLGGFLAATALGIVLLWPAGPGNGKLLLAGVSLLSTAGLVAGYRNDRSAIGSMRARLADSGIRWASLEPRRLGRYYHPAWEAVPLAVLVGSAAFTAWAVTRGVPADAPPGAPGLAHDAGLRMIATLALQGLLVLGCLVLTLHSVQTLTSAAVRLPMFRRRPGAALALDESLRGTELRLFVPTKTALALLLGFRQVEIALEAWRHPLAPWFDAGGWVLVVVLLFLFALYVLRVVRLSRRIAAEHG